MANMETLNDDVLETANGGATVVKVNKTDWTGAHWRPDGHAPGTTFVAYDHRWYVVKSGDTLGNIAPRFGVTVEHIMKCNPNTIKNKNLIYDGDALSLGHL